MDAEEETLQSVTPGGEVALTTNNTGTILPGPVASLVSIATKSSALYLRVGTFLGGLAIDGARISTLTSIELSRTILETILSRAGRDVADRSTGQLGKAEAENLLEKAIYALHATLTQASFIASTSFHLSSAVLNSASDLSQQLLSVTDSILGSTESSRAIASIIVLIRREFRPELGEHDERVGVFDLLVGLIGLALLQKWCWSMNQKDIVASGSEEVIWDVVILDSGVKADVVAIKSNQDQKIQPSENLMQDQASLSPACGRPASFVATNGTPEVIQAVQREKMSNESKTDSDLALELELRHRIMEKMPPSAIVSVTSETVTTQTVTVEITGVDPPNISLPPGMQVVEESSERAGDRKSLSYHRIVYRSIRNQLDSSKLEKGEENSRIIEGEIGGPMEIEFTETTSLPSEMLSSSPPTTPDAETPFLEKETELFSPPPPPPPPKDFRRDQILPPVGPPEQRLASRLPVQKETVKSPIANQKRPRKAPSTVPANDAAKPRNGPRKKTSNPHLRGTAKSNIQKSDKKTSIKKAFKKGASGTNLASLWSRDTSVTSEAPQTKTKPDRPPWGSNIGKTSSSSMLPVMQRNAPIGLGIQTPLSPQRGNPNYFSSRDLGIRDIPSSPSRASYYSIHESRRDSLVSQTDTFSVQSLEPGRPGSPSYFRSHMRGQNKLLRTKSEKGSRTDKLALPSQGLHHRRSKSSVPSIFTLHTNNSEQGLTSIAARDQCSDGGFAQALQRHGSLAGSFPSAHFIKNVTRFVRFASASYGSHFLRVMGIASHEAFQKSEVDGSHHFEHHSFSKHTGLPPSTIMLSSFADPQGGTDASGETSTSMTLIHYVVLDHVSKAVVLTCRGTLGFEDILTDLTCDYDDLLWQSKRFKVHKGMHASARRLIHGNDGRLMKTLGIALEEFPDYGLVFCGHSLGGGVAALLAIMLAEPNSSSPSKSSFVTAANENRQLLLATGNSQSFTPAPVNLPPGRPIHVYAYGTPATLSPSLRKATRGLITTIVNGQDVVPYLSLGVLRDLQSVAFAFKTDTSGAKREVRNRVWQGLTSGLYPRSNIPPSSNFASMPASTSGLDGESGDIWALSALKSLRAGMLAPKLMPPGEVFVLETMPVLRRDAFTAEAKPVRDDDHDGDADEARTGAGTSRRARSGRPATRAVLTYIRDVEKRFGELRFGASMLGDHSPGRYEVSLAALETGVLDR